MLKLDRFLLNVSVEQIINDLKVELLTRRDVEYFRTIKSINDDLMVTCPFHKHGQESKPSAGINKETGMFHCFTCGEAMPIEVLVSRLLYGSYDKKQGIEWLKARYLDTEFYVRPGLPMPGRKKYIPPEYITESELDSYRWVHPYMYKRHLTDEIIDKFDIGYDKETQCLTFPVWDVAGNCVFVARRSVNTKYFNYPSGANKPVYLLNFCKNEKCVFVCESFLNATNLWSWGYKAVALIGTGSDYQYNILNKTGIRKYILCLDPDNAGRRGEQRFIDNINANIEIVHMPEGKDVNDLTKEQFLECFQRRTKVDRTKKR